MCVGPSQASAYVLQGNALTYSLIAHFHLSLHQRLSSVLAVTPERWHSWRERLLFRPEVTRYAGVLLASCYNSDQAGSYEST